MTYFYNIDIYLGITITLTVDSSQTRNGAISTSRVLSVSLISSRSGVFLFISIVGT